MAADGSEMPQVMCCGASKSSVELTNRSAIAIGKLKR